MILSKLTFFASAIALFRILFVLLRLQSYEIKFVDTIEEKYNKNEFDATDGKLVEMCDKLSAYIEASLALRYGIHSDMLNKSKMKLYNKFADIKIANLTFKDVFDYFKEED